MAYLAYHLYVGWDDRVFVGSLERGRARLCLYCVGGWSRLCSDWRITQFRCLDKLADRGCCSTCPLYLWADSPRTRRIHRRPGLVAVLPAYLPADRGYAFHPMASSC